MPVFNPNRSKPCPAQNLVSQAWKTDSECGLQGPPLSVLHLLPTSPAGLLSLPLPVAAVRVGSAPPSRPGKTLSTSQKSLEAKLGRLLSAPYLLGVEPGLDSWGLGEPTGTPGQGPCTPALRWGPLLKDTAELCQERPGGSILTFGCVYLEERPEWLGGIVRSRSQVTGWRWEV